MEPANPGASQIATLSRPRKLFLYVRRAFAIICFGFAAYHWREISRTGLIIMGSVVAATVLFVLGVRLWIAYWPSSRGSTFKPYLRVSHTGITYEHWPGKHTTVLRLEIARIELVRALDWDDMLQILEWKILKHDRQVLLIWDRSKEDRRKLMDGFQRNLPTFSVDQAQTGFRSLDTGQWTCFSGEPL